MWWVELLNVISGVHGAPTPPVTNSYESISTVTVGAGGASSIDFTSIPSTYKHLQIRGIGKSNRGTFVKDDIAIQVNADTGSNYSWHVLNGNGSTVTASAGTSATSVAMWDYLGTSVTFDKYGAFIIDLLDYANTSKYKTIRGLGGTDANGSGAIGFNSGLWMSTSAISSIKLYSGTSSTIQQYSSFALYGIKG